MSQKEGALNLVTAGFSMLALRNDAFVSVLLNDANGVVTRQIFRHEG